MQGLWPALASFSICLLATVALRPIAIALDLIDRPEARKLHEGAIPLVGGLAMLLGIVLGTELVPLPSGTSASFLSACALLVAVGLIDDRFGLSPWARLCAHAAAAALFVMGSNTVIGTLGDLFGNGPVILPGLWAHVFTVLTIMAAINAFNMLDGVDGLAGAVAIVSLIGMTALALGTGEMIPALLGLVIAGAVAAFLLSNLPITFNRRVRCFMGDSGSTLLGFAVVCVGILLSQQPAPPVAPVTVLWLVALPLYDIIWSIVRRSIRGQSPFRGDKEHLHHLLLRAGFNVPSTCLLLAALALLLSAVGVGLELAGVSESRSFVALCLTGALVVSSTHRSHTIRRLLPGSMLADPGSVGEQPRPPSDFDSDYGKA